MKLQTPQQSNLQWLKSQKLSALFLVILANFKLILAFFFLSILIPKISFAQWYSETRNSMGTASGVTFWHETSDQLKTNLQDNNLENKESARKIAERVFQEFERFNQLYSSYRDDSLLSLVNQSAGVAPVTISDEFFELVQKSLAFSRLSDGLFDITYASVGQEYDYRQKRKPTGEQLQQKLEFVNYKDIQLNPTEKTIEFANTGVKIDLGGIGKGYAVDQAAKILQQAGIKNAAIYAGGDSRYLGQKEGRPWSVGIRHPRDSTKTALMIPLVETAMSTSGDYERYFIDEQGVRHHHIIHPKTGVSPRELVSATVIASDAMTSDALSTTVMLAGVSKGLALIESLENVDAILIDAKGKVHFSSGLADPTGER